MTWNYNEIERDYLGGTRVALAKEEVVTAFNRCEEVLGRNWLLQKGESSKGILGVKIIEVGQKLASLDGISGTEPLLGKLRNSEQSAIAELRAIHLLSSKQDTTVELFPTVLVDGHERKPDFRIRHNTGPWVYVEVTQPNQPKAMKSALWLLQEIGNVLSRSNKLLKLELLLRREPTSEEMPIIRDLALSYCASNTLGSEDLPNQLGRLVLHDHPHSPVPTDDPIQDRVRGLWMSAVHFDMTGVRQHLDARIAFYSDTRAERLLRRESEQLPKDGPGLVMIEVPHTSDLFDSWESSIRRRFQPVILTKVSGVCLFFNDFVSTTHGYSVKLTASLLNNPHAITALPPWIEEAVANELSRHNVPNSPPKKQSSPLSAILVLH